jgi:hypothetical protein
LHFPLGHGSTEERDPGVQNAIFRTRNSFGLKPSGLKRSRNFTPKGGARGDFYFGITPLCCGGKTVAENGVWDLAIFSVSGRVMRP